MKGKTVLWIIKATAIILAGIILATMMDQSILALSIIETGLYFSVLLFGYRYGAGSGAVVGTACGIIQTIRQEEIALLGVFCLLGVMAGMFRSLGKSASAMGFAAAAVGIGVMYSSYLVQGSMLEITAAIVVFLILPPSLSSLDDRAVLKSGLSDEDKKREGLFIRRINEISNSLGQVSKSFNDYERQQECYANINEFASAHEIENSNWRNRFLESRDAVASQFSEMEMILSDLKKEWEQTEDVTRQMEASIMHVLKSKHIKADNLVVLQYPNSRQELYVQACTDYGRCVTTKELAETLGKRTRTKWKPASDSKTIVGRTPSEIRLVEDTSYMLLSGVARATKAGEAVSGDHFTFTSLPKGKFLMCLSDGMGSGHMASAESETVIELAEQLLETGFSPERSVKLINSVLLMNRREQKPTTLDLAVLDLYSARANFVKLGAMVTFIKRNQKVLRVEKDTLPIGMLDRVDFAPAEWELMDDDLIIMMTDGVLDALKEIDKEDAMAEVIEFIEDKNPQEFADKLLTFALAQNQQPQDDMTILVAGIWER